MAKIMLNSVWGKFGQRANLPSTTYIREPAQYSSLLTSDTTEVRDVEFVNEEIIQVQCKKVDDFVVATGNTNVIIASFTTAYARLKL